MVIRVMKMMILIIIMMGMKMIIMMMKMMIKTAMMVMMTMMVKTMHMTNDQYGQAKIHLDSTRTLSRSPPRFINGSCYSIGRASIA